MSDAAANPWELFARQSRDMLESQSALTRTWLEGQSKLADAMGAAQNDGAGNAEAMGDLWRSWFSLGSAFGQAMPGMAGWRDPARWPARRSAASWIRCR